MITSVPARVLGQPQGELAPGKRGDFVVVGLDRPNLCPTRVDNVMENLIWATDGSEVDWVVARGRVLKRAGVIEAFADGATARDIMAAAQRLSERFAAYLDTAEELRGTGVHR